MAIKNNNYIKNMGNYYKYKPINKIIIYKYLLLLIILYYNLYLIQYKVNHLCHKKYNINIKIK